MTASGSFLWPWGPLGSGRSSSSTEESLVRFVHKVKLRELLPSREELRASWGPIFRGTGLGFLIGLLPGSAHVLSSFVSYTLEKRLAKRPEEFGTGRIEGVAGPETANNAASESAMIPFLRVGHTHGTGPCGDDDRPVDSRCSAGSALHLRTAAGILGPDRKHVHRKRDLDHPESSTGRSLCQPCSGSLFVFYFPSSY